MKIYLFDFGAILSVNHKLPNEQVEAINRCIESDHPLLIHDDIEVYDYRSESSNKKSSTMGNIGRFDVIGSNIGRFDVIGRKWVDSDVERWDEKLEGLTFGVDPSQSEDEPTK